MRTYQIMLIAVAVSVPQTGRAELTVSLNQDNRFTLQADQLPLIYLEFFSPSGSLVPAESAAPFQVLVDNRPAVIRFSNHSQITLQGNVTLSAGWNPNGSQDVHLQYGTFGPLSVAPINYNPCAASCAKPSINVTLDDQQRFVLHANNHSLTSLDFHSPGSLTVADSAGPFASLTSNTPQRISYAAPSSGITIDGTLTLAAGWNPQGRVGDVQYEYTEVGGNRTGMLHIPNASFPQNRHIDATINDQHQIVLTGTGHQLNSIDFSSRSGSLVPGDSAAPFDGFAQNTSEVIAMVQSSGEVVLEGEVILDVGWNPTGEQDIRFAYDGSGGTPNGSYFLSRGNYPAAGGRPEVWLSLDEDYRFLFHADDIGVTGIDLTSSDGALIPGTSPVPFQFTLSNRPNSIAYGNLGHEFPVNGSIKLDAAWNPLLGSHNLVAQYGGFGDPQPISIEVLPSDLAICPGCDIPAVSFSPGGQVNLSGFEIGLAKIHVTSASGSLSTLEDTSGTFTFDEASNSEILLSLTNGLDAFDLTSLPIAWRSSVGTEDVFVSFTTIDGDVIGPFALPASAYQQVVPEPSGALLLAAMTLIIAIRLRRI